MILETERLYLREMNQSDFDSLCKIMKDEDTMYAYEGAFSDEEVQRCRYAALPLCGVSLTTSGFKTSGIQCIGIVACTNTGANKKVSKRKKETGTIWCEHLDSMGNLEKEVIHKFREDYKTFSRPSVSSYMIINLDETIVTDQIVECIVNGIIECTKRFMKIAFVGIGKKEQRQFERIKKESGVMICYFIDYEKAKE